MVPPDDLEKSCICIWVTSPVTGDIRGRNGGSFGSLNESIPKFYPPRPSTAATASNVTEAGDQSHARVITWLANYLSTDESPPESPDDTPEWQPVGDPGIELTACKFEIVSDSVGLVNSIFDLKIGADGNEFDLQAIVQAIDRIQSQQASKFQEEVSGLAEAVRTQANWQKAWDSRLLIVDKSESQERSAIEAMREQWHSVHGVRLSATCNMGDSIRCPSGFYSIVVTEIDQDGRVLVGDADAGDVLRAYVRSQAVSARLFTMNYQLLAAMGTNGSPPSSLGLKQFDALLREAAQTEAFVDETLVNHQESRSLFLELYALYEVRHQMRILRRRTREIARFRSAIIERRARAHRRVVRVAVAFIGALALLDVTVAVLWFDAEQYADVEPNGLLWLLAQWHPRTIVTAVALVAVLAAVAAGLFRDRRE